MIRSHKCPECWAGTFLAGGETPSSSSDPAVRFCRTPGCGWRGVAPAKVEVSDE